MYCSGLSQEKVLHEQAPRKINVMPHRRPNEEGKNRTQQNNRCDKANNPDSVRHCHLASTTL